MDVATENQLQDEPHDYLNPALDRAVSDNDVRNRMVLTIMAESSSSWVAPLHNAQFSMLNTLQSPQHYSILAGSDINGDGFPFNDRGGDLGRNTSPGPVLRYGYPGAKTSKFRRASQSESKCGGAELAEPRECARCRPGLWQQSILGPVPKVYGGRTTSPANPTFGSPTFAAPARQFQFSVKLQF
jgi:hypothetical protein